MPPPISGLHHVSALAGPPQRALDFYAGVLGLRLVKRTVNFDDPGTYHLYFGDAAARPGTLMTLFPMPNAVAGRNGAGMTSATAYAVAPATLDEWVGRFADRGLDFDAPAERFGESVLAFRDPDGLPLELVGSDDAAGERPAHFHSVTLALADPDRTARVLDLFGYEEVGEAPSTGSGRDGRRRFRASGGGPASLVDLVRTDDRGRPGAGTVHHIAFRVPDDDAQREWTDELRSAGLAPTEIRDRQYFRSIYFREPDGVLFELATNGPGFAVDEPPDALGMSLKLPPWLEDRRTSIERRLPDLTIPTL